MKIKLLCVMCALLMSINAAVVSYGDEEYEATDWKWTYYSFAQGATDKSHPLNGAISGLILLDFNTDEIPELLTFSTSEYHYDENGELIYAFDEGYDSPARIDYSYTIVNGFYINDEGEVIEDSPWRDESATHYPFIMSYLPDEGAGMESEEFCRVIQKIGDKDDSVYLCSYATPSLYELSFDGVNFKRVVSDLTNNFYESLKNIEIPVVSIRFYNETSGVKLSQTDAMGALCDKYEAITNPLSTFEYMSVWAQPEVEAAVNNVLVPEQMTDDDLTENITRAEFASVAFMLDKKINGEVITDPESELRTDFEGHEYEEYVLKAYNAGITRGTAKPTDELDIIFSPDEFITREQMAVMLARIIKKDVFYDEWTPETDDIYELGFANYDGFKDDYMISDYARDSVYFMSNNEIINGTDTGHFLPQELAAREEALALAVRIYNYFQDTYIPQLNEDEILKELEGLYVTSEYVEKFKETKSLESVYRTGPILYFHEKDGKYFVMPGDFHQGSENLAVISTNEIEDGKYSVKTEKASYVGECEFIYTPGKSMVECKINSSEKIFSTGGEFKSFEHFKTYEELSRKMSEFVFEGVSNIEFDSDNVFADIDGQRYSLSFANDFVGICSDGIDMSSYDGAFWMKNESTGESELVRYRCEDFAVTLTDLDDNMVARFEK